MNYRVFIFQSSIKFSFLKCSENSFNLIYKNEKEIKNKILLEKKKIHTIEFNNGLKHREKQAHTKKRLHLVTLTKMINSAKRPNRTANEINILLRANERQKMKQKDIKKRERENIVKLVKNYFITFYYLSQQYILYNIMIKIKFN